MRIPIKLTTMQEATEFVCDCSSFEEDINLYYKRFIIDAKSILGVLSCELNNPLEVEIITDDKKTQEYFYTAMEARYGR